MNEQPIIVEASTPQDAAELHPLFRHLGKRYILTEIRVVPVDGSFVRWEVRPIFESGMTRTGDKSKPLPPASEGLKDFPLYTSGPKGVLYAPSTMSKTDFDLFKRQLESYLLVIEATSVVPDQHPN